MRRGVLAAVVAVVLALVGCAAVLVYARGADERALAGQRAVRVLVAVRAIPAGTSGQAIRDGGYARVLVMPAGTVPADALGGIDGALLSQAVTADQQPRQLLLRGAFGTPAPNRGGLDIPGGMLAVSVAMRMPAQVASYVQPGSAVAVFDTFNVAQGKGPAPVPAGDGLAANHDYDQATRLLLPRVAVLAIGARSPDKAPGAPGASGAGLGGGGSSADAQSVLVTVAVDQDQAQRLVQAAQTGALYLGLLGDATDPHPGPGTDNYSLFP
jgi:pilus assembly protein CpaB